MFISNLYKCKRLSFLYVHSDYLNYVIASSVLYFFLKKVVFAVTHIIWYLIEPSNENICIAKAKKNQLTNAAEKFLTEYC